MSATDLKKELNETAQFIVHLTDFSEASAAAFAHALRLALTTKAHLTLMHVGDDADEEDWDRFPSFRRTLQQWGLLEPGAERTDVAKLGVKVEKISVRSKSVADTLAEYQDEHPLDVLVLATEHRSRFVQWLRNDSAETAARGAGVPALFVPAGDRGCVSLADGRVSMNRVLIPVDHQPSPAGAIERGLRAIAAYGHADSKLTLLHVGADDHFPKVPMPDVPWQVEQVTRQGHPATAILAAAEESGANLIVMVTQGTHGFLDVLRGSTTEQVLRQAPCPVLTIPADF